MYHYSKAEQETTIVWDEEERIAKVYTASPVTMRKLDKLCAACPSEYRRTWVEQNGDKVTAARYEVGNCKLVRFCKPVMLTEEQKDAARERGKQNAERLASYRRRT